MCATRCGSVDGAVARLARACIEFLAAFFQLYAAQSARSGVCARAGCAAARQRGVCSLPLFLARVSTILCVSP